MVLTGPAQECVGDEIRRRGPVPFSRFMELALYAPGVGYYASDRPIFGRDGDFVTAPGISPLFAAALARQVAAVLEHTGGGVLEYGAGDGGLAAGLLDVLPEGTPYGIVERSTALQQRQRQRLGDRVHWCTDMPGAFRGVLLANEVFDAQPVEVLRRQDGDSMFRLWVDWSVDGEGLAGPVALWRLEQGHLALEARQRFPALPGYTSELCPAADVLLRSMLDGLQEGMVLIIDYGWGAGEYYHPTRRSGTLLAHHRHIAHDRVLERPGAQDLTAHVDFTRLARAARTAGVNVAGFATQANFLLNLGILNTLPKGVPDPRLAHGLHQLLAPEAQGERFKVLALTRGEQPLPGFCRRNALHRLAAPICDPPSG